MGEIRCHEICFSGVPNDWNSALPLGNGRMGAMVFVQEHVLHVALNHYDCYYQSGGGQTFQDPARFAETYQELCRRAEQVRGREAAERSHYARTLHPSTGGRPSYQGASYPMGGELLLTLDDSVDMQHIELKLHIERAEVTLTAGTGDRCVGAKLLAAEQDGILISLSQTADGLWKKAAFDIPSSIGLEKGAEQKSVEEWGLSMKMPCGEAVFYAGDSCTDAGDMQPDIRRAAGEWMTAAVLLPVADRAAGQAKWMAQHAGEVCEQHRAYWQQFWVSSVQLPDAFLESLWHLQLYLLECSCGRGSSYPEQACGLSGLWDIRRPNQWGSLWYWDVNIQSTFWGSYAAGHPELTKLFCDGYLSYAEDIREYTKKVYGIRGWALDYPHTLYHCIQPWCAQFLWLYYQYSGDTEFLKKKAYPVFWEQLQFFKWLAVKDAQGIYHVEYDISPEQGPITSDSVITIACIKKLCKMGKEAAGLLARPQDEIEVWQEVAEHLLAYPKAADGSRYKDSALVQENIFLRHPSVLMPVFPAEEIKWNGTVQELRTGQAAAGQTSSEQERETVKQWENTLRYAVEHTETGTFGMGWLAAAAAGLGRGRSALRILYEKGLDYVLHANGLAYEESERFLNYCHITKAANYLPVMMEFCGGLINAVNMMLLQTGKNGEIQIFPAIPNEKPDLLEPLVQYQEDDEAVSGRYADWQDVSFAGLMAPGGFRVSARRNNGKVTWVRIESTRAGMLKFRLPQELVENGGESLFIKQMQAGEEFCLRSKTESDGEEHLPVGERDEKQVICHEAARTRRRIFLGADRHTDFYKKVDSFICPYLLGNEHRYCQTPYIFDFGTGNREKDYDNVYTKQFAVSGQGVLYAAAPRKLGAERYRAEIGYGFAECEQVRAADRIGPDDLRCDFVEGVEDAEFLIDLPKGKYDLLVICGDEREESSTRICLPEHGTFVRSGDLPAGRYGCKILPVMQERDETLRIRIAGENGRKWKWNALFINKEYGL